MTPLKIADTELWGPGDVTRHCKFNRGTLAYWRRRGYFPEPIGELGGVDVWDARDIRTWQRGRRKEAMRRVEALRHYRLYGNVSAAARAVNANRTTVRRWLNEEQAELESASRGEDPAAP